MVSTLAIVALAVAIAISVGVNYIQYQKSASLEQAISDLQTKNVNLAEELNRTRLSIVSTQAGESVSNNNSNSSSNSSHIQQLAGATNNNSTAGKSTSQSITAVAVKTIVVNDGFFQTTSYEGALMGITVDIRPGGGLILVDTQVPTGVDFQTSARTAVKVAQSITGADLSSKDVIFSITSKGNATDLQAADGPSAGAAMTVLLVSELEGKKLNQKVLMTGTVEPDGSVGPVGGVAEKAQAAGKYGASIFLVPAGEATYQAESCQQRQEGLIIYKTCQYEDKPLSPLTEQLYKMKTIEVHTIKEALGYFEAP